MKLKRKIDGDSIFIVDENGSAILTIKVTTGENAVTIVVSGSITHDAAPDFEDELMSVLTSGRGDVIIDFSALEHISAPALRALLAVQKLVDDKRYQFYIKKNISDSVKVIFESTGFIDLIEIR